MARAHLGALIFQASSSGEIKQHILHGMGNRKIRYAPLSLHAILAAYHGLRKQVLSAVVKKDAFVLSH
jgi:hypothetical protein